MDVEFIETGDVKTSSGIHMGRYKITKLSEVEYKIVIRWVTYPENADYTHRDSNLAILRSVSQVLNHVFPSPDKV